jgi:hypothetical protein
LIKLPEIKEGKKSIKDVNLHIASDALCKLLPATQCRVTKECKKPQNGTTDLRKTGVEKNHQEAGTVEKCRQRERKEE